MGPFHQVTVNENSGITVDQLLATFPDIKRHEAENALQLAREGLCFRNDTYQVIVRDLADDEHGFEGHKLVHLSIKRLDKEPIHDWRDLQEIKNQLVGHECEAIELYPKESRLVDTSNQFHLWVFADPETTLPVGWHIRLINDSPNVGDAKQRPRAPQTKTNG